MFSGQPHSSDFDTPESRLRFGMMFAELWYDWLETMSEVTYRTHKVCESFLQDGGPAKGQYGPFEPPRGNPSESPNVEIDIDKLKDCLKAMEPMQAARVIHAVQMMQAMEAMLKGRRSRTNEAERSAW
jgi:hypothetical protein